MEHADIKQASTGGKTMAQVVDVQVPVWQGCELMKAQLALEARRVRLKHAAMISAQTMLARGTVTTR